MTELLSHVTNTLTPYLGCQRWYIAYSGGLDSHVLLDLVWRLQQCALRNGELFPELRAIHINHQLQLDSAAWAQQCLRRCDEYVIPIQIHTVDIQGRRQGTESLARAARYQVFEGVVGDGDVVLFAHHQDDQAETFLLRLLRGAGVAGLAAMPVTRPLGCGLLFRPLLEVSRSVLESYANAQGLEWIEDPSNKDPHYRRNFLRHRVTPVLAEQWPSYRESISSAAELQAEAAQLLDAYLNADVSALTDICGALDLVGLANLIPVRQRAVLRHFVFVRADLRLDKVQTQEIINQFLNVRDDGQAVFQLRTGLTLRAYRGLLYCEPTGGTRVFDADLVQSWDGRGDCLIQGLGRLSSLGGGEFVPRGSMTIRFRRGGERCRLTGHKQSKSLKKLLQEWGVPPWERDCLPLIYCDDELAAIADMAICEGFSARAGESGLSLQWQIEPLT
ncbi:MAG: tRNA(Ile)-lysidine synthase [Zhongshania sp.]|jgi:tRNA(Ile)-lysidine synthase|nr:tRNA lysidine(34) synthetase TilS [Zhongshania sp.]